MLVSHPQLKVRQPQKYWCLVARLMMRPPQFFHALFRGECGGQKAHYKVWRGLHCGGRLQPGNKPTLIDIGISPRHHITFYVILTGLFANDSRQEASRPFRLSIGLIGLMSKVSHKPIDMRFVDRSVGMCELSTSLKLSRTCLDLSYMHYLVTQTILGTCIQNRTPRIHVQLRQSFLVLQPNSAPSLSSAGTSHLSFHHSLPCLQRRQHRPWHHTCLRHPRS